MSEQQYLNLLQDVLDNGVKKSIFGHEDTYILSCFGGLLKFNLSEGFPIMTTKKTFYKGAFEEMLWFISGDGNIVDLHNKGVTIWDEWGVKYWNKYHLNQLTLLEYQKAIDNKVITSHCIPLHYGNSTKWKYTNWETTQLDSEYRYSTLNQTKWIIESIKKTPDRKSFLVSYWNPTEVYAMADECGKESVSLPACHTHYSVNVSEGKLSIMLYLRSWDTYLGGSFNIAQYALLTHMYAHCTGYKPGQLVISVGDYHLYSNHVEQTKELLSRTPYTLPTLAIKDRGQQYLEDFEYDDFTVNNYKSHPTLKGAITVVGGY